MTSFRSICLLVLLYVCQGCLARRTARHRLVSRALSNVEQQSDNGIFLDSDQLGFQKRIKALASSITFDPKCWRRKPPSHSCSPFNQASWIDSCYCNIHTDDDTLQIVRYCCDFNGYDANVTSKVILAIPEIALTNSALLDIKVNSTEVEKINIDHLNLVRIKEVIVSKPYPMRLHASYVTASSLQTFGWMKLLESNIGRITGHRVSNEIQIFHSHIGSMSNVVVSNIDDKGILSATLGLEETVLEKLKNVSVNGTTSIQRSRINVINNCKFQYLEIKEQTTFESVYPGGLVLQTTPRISGITLFRHLHRGALILNSREALTKMRDINIMQCDVPCIKLQDDTEVHFKRRKPTTIDHRLEPRLSFYIYPASKLERKEFDHGKGKCRGDSNHVECDEPLDEGSDLVLQTEYPGNSIVISQQKNVTIMGGNYKSVKLVNMTGSYLAYNTLQNNSINPNSSDLEAHSNSLSIERSNISSLFSKGFRQVTISGPSTSIEYMNLGELEYFSAENSKINYLEDLTYQRRNFTDYFSFGNGSIQNVQLLRFNSNARIQSSTIDKIQSLTIDHNEDYKRRTIIKDCTILHVESKGIHIKRGYVDIESVVFASVNPGMIFLDGTSKVIFRNMLGHHLDCSRGKRLTKAISVQRRSQVVFEGIAAPYWLRECIEIRPAMYHLGALKNYYVLKPEDCTSDMKRLTLSCQFTNTTQPEVPMQLGHHPGLDLYLNVNLQGVKNLVIGENCFSEIHLTYTYCSLIEADDSSCFYSLQLYNSKVDIIPGNIWKLTMVNSSSTRMIPSSTVQVLHAESSKIRSINLNGSVLYFKDVTFYGIRKLNVTGKLTMKNCTIEHTNMLNIVIEKSAAAIFINVKIKRLKKNGIINKGRLTLEDVIVNSGDQYGFKMFPGSKYSFSNTKFLSEGKEIQGTKTNDPDQPTTETLVIDPNQNIFTKTKYDRIVNEDGIDRDSEDDLLDLSDLLVYSDEELARRERFNLIVRIVVSAIILIVIVAVPTALCIVYKDRVRFWCDTKFSRGTSTERCDYPGSSFPPFSNRPTAGEDEPGPIYEDVEDDNISTEPGTAFSASALSLSSQPPPPYEETEGSAGLRLADSSGDFSDDNYRTPRDVMPEEPLPQEENDINPRTSRETSRPDSERLADSSGDFSDDNYRTPRDVMPEEPLPQEENYINPRTRHETSRPDSEVDEQQGLADTNEDLSDDTCGTHERIRDPLTEDDYTNPLISPSTSTLDSDISMVQPPSQDEIPATRGTTSQARPLNLPTNLSGNEPVLIATTEL